jgi:hypothetical protein
LVPKDELEKLENFGAHYSKPWPANQARVIGTYASEKIGHVAAELTPRSSHTFLANETESWAPSYLRVPEAKDGLFLGIFSQRAARESAVRPSRAGEIDIDNFGELSLPDIAMSTQVATPGPIEHFRPDFLSASPLENLDPEITLNCYTHSKISETFISDRDLTHLDEPHFHNFALYHPSQAVSDMSLLRDLGMPTTSAVLGKSDAHNKDRPSNLWSTSDNSMEAPVHESVANSKTKAKNATCRVFFEDAAILDPSQAATKHLSSEQLIPTNLFREFDELTTSFSSANAGIEENDDTWTPERFILSPLEFSDSMNQDISHFELPNQCRQQ